MTSALLLRFFDEFDSQKAIAEALGISEAYVSRLKTGARKVNKRIAEKIEEVSAGKYSKSAILWENHDYKNSGHG